MAFVFTRGAHRALLAAALMILTACGGGGGGSSASTAPPPPPVQQNRAPTFSAVQFAATEDTDLSSQVTATDPDGDALTFNRTSDPASGSVTVFNANGAFTYRPDANAFGSDAFGVRVVDSRGAETAATVTIQIAPVDDPASTRNDILRVDGAALESINVLANDVNPDREALAVEIVEPAAVGAAAVNADGTIRLTGLATGFRGVTRFKYRATEPGGASTIASAVVFVGVEPFKILFAGDEAANGSPEVFLTDLAGPPTRVTAATDGDRRLRGFVASTNGSTVAYRQHLVPGNTAHDLWFVRTANPNLQTRIVLPNGMRYVTDVNGADTYALSPDGQWLGAAVWTDPPGTAAVILINVDAPATVHIATPAGVTNAAQLQFSPDSQHLYYLSGNGSGWRLHRTALSAPTQSTPVSPPSSGTPGDQVQFYAISPDGSKALYRASRDGVANLYFVDFANLQQEVRLNHVLAAGDTISSSTVYNTRGSLGGSRDGGRIAYSVTPAAGAVATYVAEVSIASNPRPVNTPDCLVQQLRPDNGRLLCQGVVNGEDQIYEAVVDSSDPHRYVGEGYSAQYDATGDAVMAQQIHYLDSQQTQFYLSVGAAVRPFGTMHLAGTAGMAQPMVYFGGADKAIVLIGESSIGGPLAGARFALVNAWAPDRLLYLADFDTPRVLRSGRAHVFTSP